MFRWKKGRAVTLASDVAASACVLCALASEMDSWNWPDKKASVRHLATFYFASATDEEDFYFIHPPIVDFTSASWVSVSGNATKVAPDQFVLDTGSEKIRIDTSNISSKPKVADNADARVTVFGNMQNADVFGTRTLVATSVLTHRAPKSAGKKWAAEGDWIGLSGTVVQANASDFTLDYGPATVKVTSQDQKRWYDIYADDAVEKLGKGDRVTVYGKITNDMFGSRTIQMDALYMPENQRYYFTVDNADWTSGFPGILRESRDWVRLTGKVVSKGNDKLVLDSGGKRINVNVAKVPGDLKNIVEGSRVVVFGPSDKSDVFAQTIDADSVMRISAITTNL